MRHSRNNNNIMSYESTKPINHRVFKFEYLLIEVGIQKHDVSKFKSFFQYY